jgi:hypothetical protein
LDPNIYTQVDVHSFEITQKLISSSLYEKTVLVHAYRVEHTHEIVTAFGAFVETVNIAHVGDWVVINPDGEKYVLPEEQFFARYIATEIKDVYKSTGFIRAIQNPFGFPIEILAPWGKPQFGDEKCWLAVSLKNNQIVSEDRYLIEAKAFVKTYMVAKL